MIDWVVWLAGRYYFNMVDVLGFVIAVLLASKDQLLYAALTIVLSNVSGSMLNHCSRKLEIEND